MIEFFIKMAAMHGAGGDDIHVENTEVTIELWDYRLRDSFQVLAPDLQHASAALLYTSAFEYISHSAE